MNTQFFAVALTAAAFVGVSAGAESAPVPVQVETASSVEQPSVTAETFYRSMKIERGQIENPESVFGYAAELEWYGFFGGVESCHDLTNVNGRRGRYNEIESRFGFGQSFGDLTAKAAYVYKSCAGDEHDTQAVEFELEYETPWVNPVVELECDTRDRSGALYGFFGCEREWELCDGFAVSAHGGVGAGNPYRNVACFGEDRWAFREMQLGVAVEIGLCPHVKLVPGIDFYDSFTAAQRRVYDKFNGFAAVASCCLVLDF